MAVAKQKMHVKKGDTVIMIAGKDLGKKGKVLGVDPANSRIRVEGVNIVKRHTRPNQKNPQGGIIEMEGPVHSSNVSLFCKSCNKAVRAGKKFLGDGKKVRYCKNCGEILD